MVEWGRIAGPLALRAIRIPCGDGVEGLSWAGMFTGLVQCIGTVATAPEPTESGVRLRIAADWDHAVQAGESIAVNGCCLSYVEGGPDLAFDVVGQTLAATTLGGLTQGDPVNLEHAVTPSTLLGGHIVQGHVDDVAEVMSVSKAAADYRVRVAAPPGSVGLLVSRGSITVSGVSLTLAALGPDWFEVALIPTTLEETTLGTLVAGDRVNLEYDVLAKFVARRLELGLIEPAT